MSKVADVSSRKSDHLRINIEEDVASGVTTGLEKLHFAHQALPEINLGDIQIGQDLFGHRIQIPLLISSMTGGSTAAGPINALLARAAQEHGLAMGLGSMRAAIENPESAGTFNIRRLAPDILLLANLGAIQLNYGYTIVECQKVVEMVEADALVLHLNPLQEALQPGGDTQFAGLLPKIEQICHRLPVPVIVKEVGWGISGETASRLVNAGVAAIDVAGAGGTSWSQVEMHRISDPVAARVAGAFRSWGIPTAEAIRQVYTEVPKTPIFASGGLQGGIDIAKCIALGARLGGMAGTILRAAVNGEETLRAEIRRIQLEIQICMFAAGAVDLPSLQKITLVED